MDPLRQTSLLAMMNILSGNPDIKIGLIDGPVDYTHSAFQGSRIRAVKGSQLIECKRASSIACRHGTFVVGVLCAKRGSTAPAICPGCTLLIRPIFKDQTHHDKNSNKKHNEIVQFPSASPEELSDAVIEVVDSGARIINLSLGLSTSSLNTYPKLQEAYDYALHRSRKGRTDSTTKLLTTIIC
jgi:subtilisin family serine protease